MAGIAGVANPEKSGQVETMLERISYRGNHLKTIPVGKAVFGMIYSEIQPPQFDRIRQENILCDEVSAGNYVCAQYRANGLVLSRDAIGVAPLYYGQDTQGDLCFASEVKGLLGLVAEIHELLPGTRLVNGKLETAQLPRSPEAITKSPAALAIGLRQCLTEAVVSRIHNLSHIGSLLSGGLDSSTISAIARPYAERLDTFVCGLEGAPDLEHAREAAWHLNTRHHQRVVNFDQMLNVLPDVIYHLESFDAPLVRSSIMHYLAAEMASDFVPAVFSGEGGDELFAGYDYLKHLPLDTLSDELFDITRRLHNTALQRVDRCTRAHGVTPWVPFLDPKVVSFAAQIPADLKIHNGIEKWILRQAVKDLLPPELTNRPKAKFWEGAGVVDLLAQHAEKSVSDSDFQRERVLQNGWSLRTKEELLYFRIFRERFGSLKNLDWMGRTKEIPVE